MHPNKSEVYRVRMTVGGYFLDTYQDIHSFAISTLDVKLHINITISDALRGAKYFTTDIKYFFLCSKVKVYQYMRIHQCYISPEVLDEYNLTSEHFDSKGFAYLEIRKCMYGLEEAAIIAYDHRKDHLAIYGYIPFENSPGMWHHTTQPLTFTLAVNDFGIKYFSKQDANHLLSALQDKYSITNDWSGDSYLGLNINWQYDKGYMQISMPDYMSKALANFKHPPPHLTQHAPHAWTAPVVAVPYYTLSPVLPLPNRHPSIPMGKPMYWLRPSVVFLLQPLRPRWVVSSLVPKRLPPYSTR